MVAYSFKPHFVEPIKSGSKIGTIRAPCYPRSAYTNCDGHAYPGDPLTLLTGSRMRPTHIGKETCAARFDIVLRFYPIIEVIHAGEKLPLGLLDAFAREDGFAHFGELEEFWHETHAAPEVFHGVHICWRIPRFLEGTTSAAA